MESELAPGSRPAEPEPSSTRAGTGDHVAFDDGTALAGADGNDDPSDPPDEHPQVSDDDLQRFRFEAFRHLVDDPIPPTDLADGQVQDGAPQRLPSSLRRELESATNTPLDHVAIHAGEHGAGIAASNDARAVTIGRDIYLGEGELEAPSGDVRALLAHEVAHVLQDEQSGAEGLSTTEQDSVAAAELEADDFAARFREHGAAMSWAPAVGLGSAVPMRAPTSHQIPIEPGPPSRRSRRILVPSKDHPSVRDKDGEQIIQIGSSTSPGKPASIRGKTTKALASATETVKLTADSGDRLHLEVTYRLEERPAEIGEVPDVWIYTERRALLTLGTGEHAGATIIGQARIRIGIDETLDPKAAISRPSIGASHAAHVYLEASEQFVNELSDGGQPSLHADAAGHDLFVYDEPLRTLMGLKRILKEQRIAGQGHAVEKLHRRVPALLASAKMATQILEGHIKAVRSHHDGDPRLPQMRWVLGDIANWLAANHLRGRGDSEEARHMRTVHRRLLELYETAKAVKAPERDHVSDALGIPQRFIERAGEGLVEVGAMAVDTVVLGVASLGKATGGWTIDWDPISNYGQWAQENQASSADGLVAIVNGFADQWSDAIERAGNGDYRGVMDVGLDTALMLDGARTTGGKIVAKGPQLVAGGAQLVAKVRNVSTRARAFAGRAPAEIRDIVEAMADAADAFGAKQQAAGMQMAGGPKVAGPTVESLQTGLKAAQEAFRAKRLVQVTDRGIETLKRRLGKTSAPDVAEWVTRVEAAFGDDSKGFVRFLDSVGQRLIEPAPFMREVEALLGSNLGADEVATVLGQILESKHVDPAAVLAEIQWLTTRTLSVDSRAMLVKRAAKGNVNLDWVRRTRLTDAELELMAKDPSTGFREFEQISDIRSKRGASLDAGDRARVAISANMKIRGIAGELAATEIELPHGLKIRRQIASNNQEPHSDFELVAPDGSPAELEVKAQAPDNWPSLLDKYDERIKNPTAARTSDNAIERLVRQIEAGRSRGRKVYVAVTDGMSKRSRLRLLEILEPKGVAKEQLIFMSESEILRAGKQLREHMGISQPRPPTPRGEGNST